MNSLIQCVDLQAIENAFFDNRIFSYILLYTHSFTIEKHTLTLPRKPSIRIKSTTLERKFTIIYYLRKC